MNEIVNKIVTEAEAKAREMFEKVDKVAYLNQKKVLKAFQKNRIALRHFNQTSGYGYGDDGRDTLNSLFADIFGAEDALVSGHIMSGTHALTVALYGVLRPNDHFVCITGTPYDTIRPVIKGSDGSLFDFGVTYEEIPLKNNKIDEESVMKYIKERKTKMIYLQRSRGYEWRSALSIADTESIAKKIKAFDSNIIIMMDNCYGEFIEEKEPTSVGVDIIAGSLIKNPGGGIAPTGGYICGKKDLIAKIAGRLSAPSVGNEVGSNMFGYQYYYQGIFVSPHVVAQALKGSILFAYALNSIGFETSPKPNEKCSDLIRSVKFNTKEELIAFIQAIQKASPVDSFVTLEPWDMPGYDDQVIMAAGCFVQGASIELSADSPIKAPYIAYMQGGITYEHCKCAVEMCLEAVLKQKK